MKRNNIIVAGTVIISCLQPLLWYGVFQFLHPVKSDASGGLVAICIMSPILCIVGAILMARYLIEGDI